MFNSELFMFFYIEYLMFLIFQVNNISKMVGIKGLGNFSRCKYEVKIGIVMIGGLDVDVMVVELVVSMLFNK